MRILHIIPTLDRGGAEKQLALLAAGLARDEFDVHVACLTRGGPHEAELRAAGVPVTIIGKRWKFDPAAYARLKRLVRELRPDIVHTWLFAANSYGRRAAIAAGVKTIVAGERSVDPWKQWWHWLIDRRLARHTARLVINSTGVRDFYAAHGIAEEKFVVIPNGVKPAADPSIVDAGERASQRAALLRKLQLPDDTRLIVAVGRLWPQKNYKHLLWAMCLLKEIRRDFQLLVVGEGPQRWRLENYRRQVQIGEHVQLLGERDDAARLIALGDVFASASQYEGQPNAMLEAMAAGRPVVASDIPGHRDLVVPRETGYLVPLGDKAGLARWINELLNNRPLAEQLGAAGRARALAEFSAGALVARHAELYRELASA
jgi:glycosyltransferase involved in cell wall biosynthesis